MSYFLNIDQSGHKLFMSTIKFLQNSNRDKNKYEQSKSDGDGDHACMTGKVVESIGTFWVKGKVVAGLVPNVVTGTIAYTLDLEP